jgi:hypothetical protein
VKARSALLADLVTDQRTCCGAAYGTERAAEYGITHQPPATAPTPVPICALVGLVLQPPRPMSAAAAAVDKISFVFILFTFAKSFRLLLLTFTL